MLELCCCLTERETKTELQNSAGHPPSSFFLIHSFNYLPLSLLASTDVRARAKNLKIQLGSLKKISNFFWEVVVWGRRGLSSNWELESNFNVLGEENCIRFSSTYGTTVNLTVIKSCVVWWIGWKVFFLSISTTWKCLGHAKQTWRCAQ